jgi:hypothetical protein
VKKPVPQYFLRRDGKMCFCGYFREIIWWVILFFPIEIIFNFVTLVGKFK